MSVVWYGQLPLEGAVDWAKTAEGDSNRVSKRKRFKGCCVVLASFYQKNLRGNLVDLVERHKKHFKEKGPDLAEVAKLLLAQEQFSLNTPVALDLDGEVKAVAVGSLGNHLKASASLSSPVLKQWLELREDRGTEAAFEALANGENSEEFAQVWDEAQRDLANGAVASVDNLVEWVSTAREGFNDNPRHLLVLLKREGKVSAYQAPADAFR